MSDAIAHIFQLFDTCGSRGYGDGVSQTEHAVQCALLAQREGADDPLVVATLLHDIGHLIDATSGELNEFHHHRTGAEYLARYFPPTVSEPVRLHAQAKRYLCAVEPDYLDRLSRASKYSLTKQGGVMSAAEVAAPVDSDHFRSAVQLRRWDDRGKNPGLEVGPITGFEPLLRRTLRG